MTLVLLGLGAALAGDVELGTRGGVAVPVGRSGSLPFGGVDLATAVSEQHTLGLEVSASADRADPGWAPAVVWRGTLDRGRPLTPFLAAALGFALAERPAADGGNLARLAGRLAVGLEAARPLGGDATLLVAPAIGLVPGAFFGGGPFSVAAPTAHLRVAVRWAAPGGTVRP